MISILLNINICTSNISSDNFINNSIKFYLLYFLYLFCFLNFSDIFNLNKIIILILKDSGY